MIITKRVTQGGYVSILTFVIFFLFLLIPVDLAGQKTVFIPSEWDDRGIPYSMDRSYESDNFIIFWGEKAGVNPQNAPAEISFDPSETAAILEDIFTWYVEDVNFIPADHGNFALYKFIIVINETWNVLPDGSEIFTGWAFGGSYESTIGAMWIHPKALNNFTLAHEFTHSMQNMAWIDYPGHGFINHDYVGSFWETHANFMALQKNPEQLENTDPARFLSTQHFYWSSARHHYTNWMFLQYIHDIDGMEFINRLWRESDIGEHPLQTLKRLKGIGQDGLNDLFAAYAMRNVTFDYSNGKEIRYSLKYDVDSRYITRRFTIPEEISSVTGRYIVPRHLAPQDYGYNIIRLYPDTDTSGISVTFRIHNNADAGGGGTKTGFVFVKDDGTVRYSSVYNDDFTADFKMGDSESELYMVVTGAPDQHHNYAWEPGFPKIYRFPWEMRLEGAKPNGYNDDPSAEYKPLSGRSHINGGGFTSYTASVSASAYIGPDAVVRDYAVVGPGARIEGAAVVMENAVIEGNAVVAGFAVVGGNANVKGDARIEEYARVNNGAVISGNARIRGSASVFHSTVTDDATVKDNASMWGADLGGTITVGGDAEHFGSCSSGTYLQIFGLNGRSCDGSNSHSLNEDINPDYIPFTDNEMGVTGTEQLLIGPKPYIIMGSADCNNVHLVQRDGNGTGVKSVTLIDASGRLLKHYKYTPYVSVIEINIREKGLILMRLETVNGVFVEKLMCF